MLGGFSPICPLISLIWPSNQSGCQHLGTRLFGALWAFGIITGWQLSVTQFEFGISFKFTCKHVCCYSISLRGLENRFAPCFSLPDRNAEKIKFNLHVAESPGIHDRYVLRQPCNLNWRMVIMIIFAYKLAINLQKLRGGTPLRQTSRIGHGP